MILNENQAKEILSKPNSKSKISSAKAHESQLRVFTEELSKDELEGEQYWKTFISQMNKRSPQKAKRVMEFARFPLPVVQLCDSVLNDFYKVFEGKNRYFHTDGDREIERLNQWISENNPVEWIETNAKQVFKNKPISFVVVDVDNGTMNPYLILIDANRLIDAKFKDDGYNLEYIAFIHSKTPEKTFYSLYDEKTFFVFSQNADSNDFNFEYSAEHQIGYCPGIPFIQSKTNSKNEFKRRVAFSSSLSKLEDWTSFDIFRNYVDHYAPFPITESPKNKCKNPSCIDGKIENEEVIDHGTGQTRKWFTDCPVCDGGKNGSMMFPGTHIGITVNADGKKDGSGVTKMIFPDTDKMKYIPEKLDDLELEVRFKTVGVHNVSNEAFNELQVKGSFESMGSVLVRTKSELDCLYKWIIETVGRIFYKDIKLNIDANFGTEFYLTSEEDLQKRFEKAKSIGLPMEEVLNIYRQLIETKYKGNTNKMTRLLMLLDLDPFPMLSVKEVVELKSQNAIDEFELSLKVNFLNFISKFENENVTITEFGKNIDYWKRIETIRKSIEQYNNELIKSRNNRLNNN